MNLSRLASSIAPSPTLALNEEARLLREKGEPVINLGIGEPKNKTPLNAVLSAANHLVEGNIKYTPPDGTPALKKAIITYSENNYLRSPAPQNIVASNGAKQSLFNTLFCLLNPNDEVILLAPYWVSYSEMIRISAGVPVIVTPEKGSFVPHFKDILAAITPKTKAIIVNSPNNPSGAVFPSDLLAQIVELCEKRSIFLISDDIYHKLVFDETSVPSVYGYSSKRIDDSHLIVVNGISKLYGMTGIRLGWVVAPRHLAELMTNIQSQMTSSVSSISQAAAVGALTGEQGVVENLRLTFQNNRDIIFDELSSFTGVHTTKPDGTFYIFPDFHEYSCDSIALSKTILDKARVVTVPGREFGLEGHLRLSFAGSAKEIVAAIDRIKWVLDPKSPEEIYMGDRRMVRTW